MPSPKQQLDSFLKKFEPGIAKLASQLLVKLRRRLPGAIELVYDNYNALAIGLGPSEKVSALLFSVVVYPRWVSLYFFYGARLMDSHQLLQGKGKQGRFIVIADVNQLDDVEIDALITQSVEMSDPPLNPKQKRLLIIKSISAKQRPRRPAGKS